MSWLNVRKLRSLGHECSRRCSNEVFEDKKTQKLRIGLSHFDSQHGAYVFVNDVAYADGWSDLWGMRMSRVKKSVIRITSFVELLNLEYNDGKTMK